MEKENTTHDKPISIEDSSAMDEEDIINRLIARGRDDDKPEIIKNRFKSYNNETEPLIPYYKNKGILKEIDGMNTVENVFKDIKKVVGVFWILTC